MFRPYPLVLVVLTALAPVAATAQDKDRTPTGARGPTKPSLLAEQQLRLVGGVGLRPSVDVAFGFGVRALPGVAFGLAFGAVRDSTREGQFEPNFGVGVARTQTAGRRQTRLGATVWLAGRDEAAFGGVSLDAALDYAVARHWRLTVGGRYRTLGTWARGGVPKQAQLTLGVVQAF